jgi:hypothetical protein
VNGVHCVRYSLPRILAPSLEIMNAINGRRPPFPHPDDLCSPSLSIKSQLSPLLLPARARSLFSRLPLSRSVVRRSSPLFVAGVRPRHRSPPRRLWRLTGARCSSSELVFTVRVSPPEFHPRSTTIAPVPMPIEPSLLVDIHPCAGTKTQGRRQPRNIYFLNHVLNLL